MSRLLILVASVWLSGMTGFASAEARDITLTTADGVSIRATLSVPNSVGDEAAAIILIHQGGSNRDEWSMLTPGLLTDGYIVLAYDVRGHGESDKVESIRKLFDDPDQAPLDLQAAIQFLQARPEVDPERIAVVGASIGGNLAAMASSEMPVRTAVAISAKTSATYNLAGKTDLEMRSVFFISSADDQGGKRAAWATELFELTLAPHRLEIVANSSRHGVEIFVDDPGLQQMILEWLAATL